jgi:hypothetical protein
LPDIDRDDKFEQYRKAGVMHYWMIDPADRSVEGWTLRGDQYSPTGRAVGTGIIRLAPFPNLDIRIERLALIEETRPRIAELCRKHRVKKLELFGSAASGDFDAASSDIDFFTNLIFPTSLISRIDSLV